jgi:predicted NAD/FAD-dependent oxidoreductase
MIRYPYRSACAGSGRIALLLVAMTMGCRHALGLAAPTSRDRVAIIGGGVAGLRCAQVLAASFEVTVFDTGRLRPGGRCSSRLPGDKPDDEGRPPYQHLSRHVVDHAAQIITVPPGDNFRAFGKMVQNWEEAGVLSRFPPDTLFSIENTKDPASPDSFRVENCQSDQPAYYGTQGMNSVPQAMLKERNFDIVQDVWVSPSNGVRYLDKSGQWKVQAAGKTLGHFDRLVIAHNGKCADRLMSKSPAKAVHNLLRVNFASSVAKQGGNRMTLNSIYSLTFALAEGSVLGKTLPDTFMAAFVKNEPSLRFLSCQSRKYPSDDSDLQGVEVWTLLSSAPFAKKHKAPQEFLPESVVQNVTTLMVNALEGSLGLAEGSVKPLESRLQLWGAAVPLNTWENGRGIVYDDMYRVGVCGDWLVDPSIAGAWTSGDSLGQYLCSGDVDSTGLDGSFRRSEQVAKAGIGSLATSKAAVSSHH